MYAIWLAQGDSYIAEAQKAAARVKKLMPDVTTCLFSSGDFRDGFDRFGAVSPHGGPWYTTLVLWCRECLGQLPEDAKVLYFDTDTYMVAPVYDLYKMLDKYDFLAVHAPARVTPPLDAEPTWVPDAFPEVNVGVIGFRNNRIVDGLFSDWAFRHVSGEYGNNDQRSLRAALWASDASLYILPPEYNFRFGLGGFAGRTVKILHGRATDIEKIAQMVTFNGALRTWKQGEWN